MRTLVIVLGLAVSASGCNRVTPARIGTRRAAISGRTPTDREFVCRTRPDGTVGSFGKLLGDPATDVVGLSASGCATQLGLRRDGAIELVDAQRRIHQAAEAAYVGDWLVVCAQVLSGTPTGDTDPSGGDIYTMDASNIWCAARPADHSRSFGPLAPVVTPDGAAAWLMGLRTPAPPSGSGPPTCGDGVCDAGETADSCPIDCGDSRADRYQIIYMRDSLFAPVKLAKAGRPASDGAWSALLDVDSGGGVVASGDVQLESMPW